jgi:adenylate cyclase
MAGMADSIDFEAEGLLDGLEGEARAARLRLLRELGERGVSLSELRRSVEEGRLALVPVERVLSGEGSRYTPDEVAERAGVDRDFLDRQWRALGMALAADGERVYTDRDVEAARRIAALREAGLADEDILEIARLLGMTMSQLAAANRSVVATTFVSEDDTEYETGMRLAAAAEAFLPLATESLGYVLNLHLREQIRHDAFAGGDELGAASAQRVAVCFADMVGFTRLGETLTPDHLGAVTGRFGELAAAAVEPPARLVKLIGDAAMIVGPDPGGIVDSALDLIEAAAGEGSDFPILRAGVALGEALPRGGDWYGRPVNLASRITDRARPASVLADGDVHAALEDRYEWSFAGQKRLKGIEGEVPLYRCRRPGDPRDREPRVDPDVARSILGEVGELLGATEDATVRGRREPRRRRARPS